MRANPVLSCACLSSRSYSASEMVRRVGALRLAPEVLTASGPRLRAPGSGRGAPCRPGRRSWTWPTPCSGRT
eukprot:638197-Lingulodinium_polyedra.AAC.1